MGKFECIWLETEQNLHYPLLVSHNLRAEWSQGVFLNVTDVDKVGWQLYLIVIGFSLLDHHHVLDSLHYVKLLKICSEFALLDLRKVKHVLDHKLETERARLLNF